MKDMALLGRKAVPFWEAEVIDPQSKFIISHVAGERNEDLIQRLLTDASPTGG